MAGPEPPVTQRAPRQPKDDGVRGTRIGRYELLFELARGGMGTVYVARMVGTRGFDRLVAIKRLNVAPTAAPDEIEDLVREARLTARIHHPNVVQTLELGEDGGLPFIVMELVQGVSLSRLLGRLARDARPLDPDLAGWILEQAARGLAAAHALLGPDGEPLYLVHRDVSPQNVLVSFEGRVMIADFGIAKLAEAPGLTEAGVLKGKVGYMAPEQTRGELVDSRADVFCLGIVFFEMLSGERLFEGGSPADSIRRIADDPPPDLREARPELPVEWIEIAERCLAKRREDRYPDAKAVSEAARRVLRERRAVVGEADLAELVTSEMAAERQRMQERLRARADASTAESERPRAPTTVTGTVKTAGVELPLVSWRRWWWLAPAAVLAASVAYGLTRVEGDPPSAVPSAGAASTGDATRAGPDHQEAPTRQPPAAAASGAASASAPPAPLSASAKAGQAPSKPSQPSFPTPPPPASPPTPPPTATSVKGVPFQSLDDD